MAILKDVSVYRDISVIPIWNYWHAQTDSRYLHCAVKHPEDVEKYEKVIPLEAVWEDLQQQYLQCFGYGDKAAELMDLRRKRLQHEIKFDLGDNFQKTHLLIIDKQILELVKSMESKEEVSLEDAVASIEEHRKVGVDPHNTTAKQFFTYSERLVTYVKARESAQQKASTKGRK